MTTEYPSRAPADPGRDLAVPSPRNGQTAGTSFPEDPFPGEPRTRLAATCPRPCVTSAPGGAPGPWCAAASAGC